MPDFCQFCLWQNAEQQSSDRCARHWQLCFSSPRDHGIPGAESSHYGNHYGIYKYLAICTDLYRSVLQITPHQESIRKVQTLWQSGHICKSFNARRCDGSLEQGDPRSFRGPYNEVHTKKRLLVTSDTDLANFLVFIWVLTTTTVLFVYICITCCVSAMFPFEMHAFLLPSFSDLAQKERF